MGVLSKLAPESAGAAREWVEVPGINPPWRLPVIAVRGRREGPRLAVTAGVHASEYAPMEGLRRFMTALNPEELHGTITAVLMVNTPGFPVRSVFRNPRDGKNINRVFPGSATGSDSERLAHFLIRDLIADSDAYIDCHCGDMVEALIPFTSWARTGTPDVDTRSEAMAKAYGDSLLFASPLATSRGMAYTEAAALGIPAMLGEVGQQGRVDESAVEAHVLGLRHVLGVLGMCEPPSPRNPPRAMDEKVWLAASASGSFHPAVKLGDQVVGGQHLGDIRDVFGEKLEEVVSPADGLIFVILTGLAVAEGEALMAVGAPAPLA